MIVVSYFKVINYKFCLNYQTVNYSDNNVTYIFVLIFKSFIMNSINSTESSNYCCMNLAYF